MINNCTYCNSAPVEKGMISCENEKCLEFGVEHFIWDWQSLKGNALDIEKLTHIQDVWIEEF